MSVLTTAPSSGFRPLGMARLAVAMAAAGVIAAMILATAWPIDIVRSDGGSLYAAAKVPDPR